ncbi:hypothetical protein R6Q59_036781 [Mikania micrantha]
MRTTLDDSFINDDDTEDDDENASNSDEENEIDVDDDEDEDDDIVDTCYSSDDSDDCMFYCLLLLKLLNVIIATEKTFKRKKNIKLIKKFEKNNCKPLPIEVEDEGGQYKFVGENCSDFIRLISNEEYFDLDSLRNTDQWEGIRLYLHAECQRAYKDRKQEFKKHFDYVGGYEDVEKARTKPPEELDQQAWEQLIIVVPKSRF